MMFSKSFGYALRGVLYIAMAGDDKIRVQLDEIAEKLSVPRHFLGKVLKQLVREGIIDSLKGPYGGYYLNAKTLDTHLVKFVEITGEVRQFDSCVLRLRKCDAQNPCPLHRQMESFKKEWITLLSGTTIGDLLKKDQPDFIRSISTI